MVMLAVEKLSDDLNKLKDEFEALKRKYKDLEEQLNNSFRSPEKVVHEPEVEALTMKQLRAKLQLSRNAVEQLIREGNIRMVRLGKRTIRYVKSEIDSLFKSSGDKSG